MALRLEHYAMANEGKGSAALVETIVFMFGVYRLFHQKIVRNYSLYFLYFEVLVSFCQHFLMSSQGLVNKASIIKVHPSSMAVVSQWFLCKKKEHCVGGVAVKNYGFPHTMSHFYFKSKKNDK